MSAIEASHVSYRYGAKHALHDVSFTVPEGAYYALVGPNGSGKTTLLQLLSGVRHSQQGRISLMGIDAHAISLQQRARIGYIAEGQALPGWMRLDQLEAFLAPLYPTWDKALASDLRTRFDLDPTQKVNTLSRGQHMKAALLCSLAPRPKVIIMDEPFTGMDALVKDELVRGLLDTSGSEGWTVLICSHDISELELLADWFGFLRDGRLTLSESMESLQSSYRHVTLAVPDAHALVSIVPSAERLSVERAGGRATFIERSGRASLEAELRAQFPSATHVEVRSPSLRELFVALAKEGRHAPANAEVAA
jgi:ABC-2 type transport system ATP-binding protein